MADYAGEKSLEPTPHRRQQARNEGHVAKSRELTAAVLLLAGLAVLMTLGGGLAGWMVDYCREQLGGNAWLSADSDFVVSQWHSVLWTLGRYLLPILGLLCLAGVAVNIFQVGFLFLPQRLTFDLNRLNPLEGLRRIFSGAGMVNLGQGIVKLAIASAVAGVVMYNQCEAILGLTSLPPATIASQMMQILLGTAMKVGGALLVLALLDYAYQWWRHEQDLKMTPQELREELRNLEGNPQVIARRKQVQRDLVLKRLSALVPEANIVLTNPSQLAVAVRYDPETMTAPVVVAKGAGASAEHIRQVAARHGVPTLERKQLARAIYRGVDTNRPIPADHYEAVAEALTQIAER